MEEGDGGECTFVERKEWTLENEDSGQRRIIKKEHLSGQWRLTASTSGHFAVDEKCISENQSDCVDISRITRGSSSSLTDDSVDDSVFLHEHETSFRDVESNQSLLDPERMTRWTFEKLSQQSSTPIKSVWPDDASLSSSDIIDSPCVEGGVRILRQVRRSVSIDKDGRRSQLSNRLVERRKTLEVDQKDLSGIGTKHVSSLEFRVGPAESSAVGEERQVSEINVVWGKIVDTHDAATARRNLDFTDLPLQSPTQTGSMDDSVDYWSADMSSDSFMTFDSSDTFVDTGDSMYTSDSNLSFIERSEILLDVSRRSVSLEPQSVVVSKIIGDKSVEVTRLESVSSCEDTIELAESPWQVSKVFIDRRKTVDVDQRESDWSSLKTLGIKKQLFRVSENIALLGRGVKRSTSRDMDSEDSSYHTDTERIVTVISEADDGSGSEPSLMSPFEDSRTYISSGEKFLGSQEDIADVHYATGSNASVTVVNRLDIGVNLIESGVLRDSVSPGSGRSIDDLTASRSQEDLLDLQADSLATLENKHDRHDTYTNLDGQEIRHLSIHRTVSADTSSHDLELKYSSNHNSVTVDDSCLSSVDLLVMDIQDSNVQSSQSVGESVTAGENLNLVLVNNTISEDEAHVQIHEMEGVRSEASPPVNVHQINDVVRVDTMITTHVTDVTEDTNDVTDTVSISVKKNISFTNRSVEISATGETGVTYATERTDEILSTNRADELSVTDNTDEVSITDNLCETTVTERNDELVVAERTDEIYVTDRTDTEYITDTNDEIYVTDRTDTQYITDTKDEISVTDRTDAQYITDTKDEISVTDRTDIQYITDTKDEISVTDRTDAQYITDTKDEISVTDRTDIQYITDTNDEISVTDRTDTQYSTDTKNEIPVTDRTDTQYITDTKDEISVTDRTDTQYITDTNDEISVTDMTDTQYITDIKNEIPVTDRTDTQYITDTKNEIPVTDRTDTQYITDTKDEICVTDRIGHVCDKDDTDYSLNLMDDLNETDNLRAIDKTEDTINTSAESSVVSVTKADELSRDDYDERDNFTLVVNKKKNRRKKKQTETSDPGLASGTDDSMCTIDGETRQCDVSQRAPVQCSDSVETAASTERSEDFIVIAAAPSQLRRSHVFGGVSSFTSGDLTPGIREPALNLSPDDNSTSDDRIAKVKEPDVTSLGDVTSGTQVSPREGYHGDVSKQVETEMEQDEKDFMSGFFSVHNMAESGDAGLFSSDDGTLLNLSTSHRRILKPHRRFKKPSSNAASDTGDAQEGDVSQAVTLQTESADTTTESAADIDIETSPASESLTLQTDEPQQSPKSTSRSKRKRDLASARGSTATVGLPDARDSGGSDVSQEEASSPVEVDRAEQFLEAVSPTVVVKKGSSAPTCGFDANVNIATRSHISGSVDDTVELKDIDSATAEKADDKIEDTTPGNAVSEMKDTATLTVGDTIPTVSETEDTTFTVSKTEDTTLTVFETEDTTPTVPETEDTTLTVSETEDTTLTVSETEDTTLTVPETENTTLTVSETEDTTLTVPETQDTTLTVPETEDTTLTVSETEDATFTVSVTEDTTLIVFETEDTTLTEPETEDTTLTVSETEDTTLTVPETEDTTLTVPETQDTTLTVPETEDTTLTVSETEDTTLTVSETEDTTLTVSETEDTTLTVSEIEDTTLTVSETEDTTLTVSETEDTTLTVPETEDTTLTVSETEDTTLTVPETQDTTLTVPETQDTTLTVPETEDIILTVTKEDDTSDTVAEAEDTRLRVSQTKDTTFTVSETEDTTITEVETEDKTLTVAAIAVQKTKQKKKKRNKKKKDVKDHKLITLQETVDDITTHKSIATIDDTAVESVNVSTNVGDTTILTATEAEDITTNVGDTTIFTATETEDITTNVGDTTLFTATETEDFTTNVGDTTILTATEAEDITTNVASKTIDASTIHGTIEMLDTSTIKVSETGTDPTWVATEKAFHRTEVATEIAFDTTNVASETAYDTTDATTETSNGAALLNTAADLTQKDIPLFTTVEGNKTTSQGSGPQHSETVDTPGRADADKATDIVPVSIKKKGKKNKKQKKTQSGIDKTRSQTSALKHPEDELKAEDTRDRIPDTADITCGAIPGADKVGQAGNGVDTADQADLKVGASDVVDPEAARRVGDKMDSGPGPNIDRREETFTPTPPSAVTFQRGLIEPSSDFNELCTKTTLRLPFVTEKNRRSSPLENAVAYQGYSFQRLYEEVLKNKAHAEEVVAQGPDSGHGESSEGVEITLTPAARLMSELALLETAAREQTESLQLAVAHKEHYDKQMLILSKGIAEAQQKLQASPVSASSVGDLKKQMQERSNLAAQIKKAQVILNEVQEKSRQLTLDSAMLNPHVFRKHYLPESAYSDFFTATAQHQRGSATLPPFSNLFYDSLPSFSSSELPLLFDSPQGSTLQLPVDNLNSAQFAGSGDVGSLDFVLPKKIPPPKTDSIPRPTWSDCVPSKSDPGRSGNYTLSQSIDSPLSTVGSSSFESGGGSMPPRVSALHGGSSKMKAPPSSTYAAEAGPEATLTSFDSGVDSTVSSLADKLMTSSAQLPKTPPVGGSPTEILRMLGEDFAGVEITSGEKEDETSWVTLQQQIHAKERELQEAVEMQEKFQQLVQDITTKMEKVSMRLTQSPASAVSSLETQMDEYQVTLKEMESIKGDISKVKEWGERLISSPDSEDYKTMESTLRMLQDRYNNLETQAEEKGRMLLDAQRVLDQQVEMKKDYKNNVKNLALWIHEMRLKQETMALTSDDPVYIRTLLDDNKDMQEEINNRLCQLSDLALQCDSICGNETPESAEKLRTQLAQLQNDLGEFKMKVIEKQSILRTDLKEIEKRKQELEEHEASMLRMQKLMTDSKQLTSHSSVLPEDHNLDFQELASDIQTHKDLVRQISDHQTRSHPPLPSTLEQEMRENWLRLGRDQDDKRDNLKTILSTSRLTGDALTLSTYGESKQKHFDKQFREVLDKVRDVTGDCKALLRQKNISASDITTFEQQYQSLQQDIANLLDLAQEKILSTPATNEEQIKQNEELQRQLRTLQQEITTLDREADTFFKKGNCTNRDVMMTCMKTLKDRLKMLTAAAESQGSELCAADLKWKQYQSDVSVLKKHLQDVQELVLQPMPTLTLEQLVENNQRIETELKSCEVQLEELKRKESSLTYPKEAYLSDLSALQSHFIELQKWAMEKRSNVQKSISVHDQYQKMLKDYETFLETAEAKLRSDSITARDLNHLKQQLSAHKDFFSDLEANKAMLDSLANKCNEYTRSSLQHKLSALINLTSVLVDKASFQGQRLERLVKEWTDCDCKLSQVQKNLHTIELNIPPHVNCADSLTTIQNKLSRFKSLQQELSEERNMVYDVVEKGKVILHSVSCPSLETAITDLAEKWVSLNTELTNELKRTEILGDQLSTFESDAANLTSWLISAKKNVASFRQLPPSDLETIAAVRKKVEKVLEFRKEIENQLPLKNRVIEVGNKLLQNKNYDTRGLSDRLGDFEEEWKQLDLSLSEIEKFLYERQMDLMPSRQALSELTTWINKIRNSLQKDAQKKVETVADIELMMKKYKDYKIELTSRQMPVDFVNQKILAPQPDEVNVPHEKLEFAEKLGQLNKKWKDVLQNVNERLNTLKSLHSKWEDFDESLKRLQTWFSEQEDTIRRYKLIGHEIGVKQTLKDCKAIQQQLKVKSEDINHLRALGNSLIEVSQDSPGCQLSVRDSIVRVEQSRTRLEDQINKMESLLTDMTDQWGLYHRDLASLNMLLTQTEYSLNQYSLVAGDIVTLRSYVARLQGLERELNQSAGQLDGFTALARQLKQVCEPAVQADIQRTVDDLHARWRQLGSELTERCHKLRLCQGQWEELDRHYIRIQHWLEEREALCNEILNARDNPLKQQECLKRLKEIQSELDNYQLEMSSLYQSTDLVMKYLSPSTMAVVRSRNSVLEQRMLTLRKLLSHQTLALMEDLSQLTKFNKAFEAVEKLLNSVQAELRFEDPDRSAEEDALKGRQNALSKLISSFLINYSKLDAVNDLGYRLALNDNDATRLKELNHRWQRLYEETKDRCRKLQEHLLVQQDFAAKCQTWMTFLAQTERDLAKEPKGSLHDLKEQLRQCEHFESEAYSHQQVLHAIIADGMKMMRAGEVEDSEEFQRKLNLLSDQWQSVSKRVHHRRVLIEGLISQWNQFYSLNRQLKQWLEDKEENLKACELETDSLHVIRTLMDKVKTTQHEFISREATLNKLLELGTHLLHNADFTEAVHVQEILNDLQNRWTRIFGQLGNHKSRFEDVNKQWLDCEGDIEDILNWLKDTRLLVQSDLPTTYDEIKKELTTCRDISMDFSNKEGKRQNLIMKERQLSKLIQTEDMNVLCQRIGLLSKQWEELQQQTLLREQRLLEALYRWTNVSQSIQSLIQWIDDMEMKIVSNRDIQVEDLLAKLEKDYRQEMESKEIEKNEIVSQGRHLVRVSSEIRASDIEQKILRLEEKWERLQALIDFRRKKLKETVLAVKQLDTSLKNLSQWLSSVETELSCGIAYKETNLKEIQTKLEANKDLQKEIETHSAGVSSVLNLCEVLLHDPDACPTETEFLALQHARKNLEKRWRNICTLSPQRRTNLEETWRKWEQFQKDCQRFADWLTQAEREVKDSELEIPNVKVAKEEIQKYEKLQRNVHEHLSDLEQINRHYCQLAKEGRTDMDGSLKVKMTDLNNRWDTLQLKITEIMKKLKNSASILDDFEKTRSSLMTWLRHVDLQLNEIQDMTNLDLERKVNYIRNIEDEIQTRRHRMEYLDQAALFLIQKGDSQQALRVQRELDEFKALSKRIFEKLVTTKLRIERLLVAQGDVLFDSRDKSYFCLSSEDHLRRVQESQATTEAKQQTENIQRYRQSTAFETSPSIHKSSSSPSRVNLSAGRLSRSPSRWTDSSAQRSQSPSPIRSRSPDRSFSSPTSKPIFPLSPRRRMSPSPDRLNTARRSPSPGRLYTSRRSPSPQQLATGRGSPTHRSMDFTDGTESLHLDASRRERMTIIEVLLEELVDSIGECNSRLLELETLMCTNGDEKQQIQHMVECEVAISKMDSLHRLLKTEMGHESMGSVDHEVKLTQQKWQNLKLSASEQNSRSSQDLAQFSTNLDKMLAWLDEAEALLSTQRPIPVDIDQMNIVIRQFNDFMAKKESQRVLISSINLMSSGYLMANNATTRQLKRKLQEMNNRWDHVLLTASEMERDLQVSLIECQEFHHNIQDYIIWLENLEQKVHYCEPINSGDQQKLIEKYQILLDVYENLQSKQSKIVFLRETADKLLISTSIPEMATTRDNIHTISRRMRSLINITSSHIASLEKRLQFSKSKPKAAYKRDEVSSFGLSSFQSADPLSSQPIRIKSRNKSPFSISRKPLTGSTGPLLCTRPQDSDNLSTELDSSPEPIHSTRIRPSLLMRVIRAAIPFLLLLLLFLLFACLVPYCEDEYSCLHSNNMRNSLSPMLSYTDGAPPV